MIDGFIILPPTLIFSPFMVRTVSAEKVLFGLEKDLLVLADLRFTLYDSGFSFYIPESLSFPLNDV